MEFQLRASLKFPYSLETHTYTYPQHTHIREVYLEFNLSDCLYIFIAHSQWAWKQDEASIYLKLEFSIVNLQAILISIVLITKTYNCMSNIQTDGYW